MTLNILKDRNKHRFITVIIVYDRINPAYIYWNFHFLTSQIQK